MPDQSLARLAADSEAGDQPSWGPNNQHRILNTRIPRVDGPFKVSGSATYTYDVRLPGMLFGRILRSPHARARVKSLDLSRALKIPGVGAAVARASAGDDVRFEGDPVAAVAATTAEIADDAIHAIDVQYEVLPHVVTIEDAIKPGAAEVFADDPEVRNNRRGGARRGDPAKVDEALKTCDVVVEAEYRTPTLHHTCLETHAVVVDYRGGDSATVYCSTQGTFTIPGDAAQTLGLHESKVTGIVHYMGGGFGSKFGIGIEGQFACMLARQAKAPVKMALTRKDEFLMAGNGGSSWQKFRAGANRDGRVVAMHATQYRNGGLGEGNLAGQPYIYHFPAVFAESTAVHTNVDSARALRAPGHPPACFAMESLMDELADKLGVDPLQFRLDNLSGRNPLDEHLRQLQRGAKEIGWERRSKIAGGWPGTLKHGFGCAIGVWGGGGGPQCVVTVDVGRDGAVGASVGSQDLGTGTRTYISAIVAEELGLAVADVKANIGDSRLGNANGSGGSSTAASLAPAVKVAAFNARRQIAARVAPLLGAAQGEVTFADGQVQGNGKSLSWQQACAALPAAGISVQGTWQNGLSSRGTHGACFAEVEVDVETGHVQVLKMVSVQDCGLPLNRLAVESQINGGMVQGVGMALTEGRVMDSGLGVMVNSSFMDYKIPGCLEIPQTLPLIDDEDTRTAVVGVGEPPSVPPAAAIANAVFNACGVRVRELPITPDKILTGLMKG
jgi:xanthine dehydrogenase YagR molybdenum-binding subunit